MKMQGLEIKQKPAPCKLCGSDAVLDCVVKKRVVDGEVKTIILYFARCSKFRCSYNTRSWLPYHYSENVDAAIASWDGRYPDV